MESNNYPLQRIRLNQMKLTNQQITDARAALEVFNPKVDLKTKLRLSRNLRKLTSAWQDLEHDRTRLIYSHVQDKSKKVDPQTALNAQEYETFQTEYQKLLAEEVEVEIHEIYIFDSETQAVPGDVAIDLHKTAIENGILARLIDIVLIECPT